ncbi:hypothetical protein L1987_52572 [Smallanthus sonchifolius]|uniref:Uncharacterized protein n=1 Tax=Smallanthus sonchifolius TaxID=185202 RepID=A0ACB9ET63_9ASTR|nr:hypothetical protein L1987_52572 [Smallanthus sonchifolius]
MWEDDGDVWWFRSGVVVANNRSPPPIWWLAGHHRPSISLHQDNAGHLQLSGLPPKSHALFKDVNNSITDDTAKNTLSGITESIGSLSRLIRLDLHQTVQRLSSTILQILHQHLLV